MINEELKYCQNQNLKNKRYSKLNFQTQIVSLQFTIYRLLRIWRAEVEKKGVAKASFDRVWRKFIQTRVLVGLLMMTLMALASFMSSVYTFSTIKIFIS